MSAKISALSEKQTLVGNDVITILDSEDSNANKKAKVSAVDTLVSTYTGTAPIDITSKVVSIATANTNTSGALTSTDWNTFNGKQDVITASAPLDLTSNTLTIATADASTTGALSSTDWGTFNGKQDAITASAPLDLTSNTLTIATADASTTGALSSTDWGTFNGKQDAITASAPLDLTSNTLTIATADTNTSGAISSTDWNTFNSKANAQEVIADAENTTAILELASNTLYTFSEPLTALTISSIPSGTYETEIQFTADTGFTFTDNALTNKWLGVDAPTFEDGSSYVIAIKNGYGVCAKVGA
jgi:nicotinamide mononucleotide (NMN) deamidase PncC